jgi:serine/threonine-protein kinase
MSPEQIEGRAVTLQTDLFAAGIVLWELLTGHRLFLGDNAGEVALKVVSAPIEPPSRVVPSRASALAAYDAFFAQGLSRDPEARFSSARQMREALEACGPIAPGIVIADWLQNLAHEALFRRAKALSDIEGSKLAVIPTPLEVVPVSVASSSVSPSIEDRPLPARARRRVSLLWPLVAMLGATIVVLLFFRHAPSQAASPSVPIVAEQSAPLPAADPIPPAAPPTTESAVPVEPAAPLHAGSSSPARPSPRATRAATSLATAAVTAAGQTSAPSSPSAPAARECVPYTWDAHGIKHYNPACL